jgi:putative ABC transport system permease protein
VIKRDWNTVQQWHRYVREHLPPLDITPEREIEIVEELALQLEGAYESARARGASEEEARARACAEVPDWRALAATLARIERRPSRAPVLGSPRGDLMSGFIQDVRYAGRALLRAPGFAVVATVTLALGIGATTIVYALVDGILLRPLPIKDPARVVLAREINPAGEQFGIAWPNFRDWQARAQSFENLAAWRGRTANLTGIADPQRIYVRDVTWNLFDVLGVQPIAGRGFTAADDVPEAARVCLISYGFWERHFGADPSAIGQRILLDEVPVTIVGVLPRDFTVARVEDAFLPMGNLITPDSGLLNRGNHFAIAAIGRLTPGATVESARSELQVIATQLAAAYPDTNSGVSATAQPLFDVLVAEARPALGILAGAVAAMLLIACVNIANLQLVRAMARAQEMEVRRALGAERWRLLRQLLTESVLLALAGGAAGVAIAYAGFGLFVGLLPAGQPRIHQVAIDSRVLIFATATSVGAGLLFGLMPALHAGSRRAGALLRSVRVAGTAAGHHATRQLLLVVEVALSLVLLVAAGLMAQTMSNLLAVDLGFTPEQVLTAQMSLPSARYTRERRRTFYSEVEERLRALPGVTNVAFTLSLPVSGSNWNSVFIVEGLPVPERARLPSAAWTPITPSYFDTLGIRLLRGRGFTAGDIDQAPRVAVVNEAFARTFWPDGDAIGKRIKQGWPEDKTPWREIVGIVNDVKTDGVDRASRIQAYLPLAQESITSLALVVRTAREPDVARRAIEAAVHAIDPNLPIFDVRTLPHVIQINVGTERLLLVLLLAFGGLSLLLAAIGVFGVNAYAVSQRTHEFGVRMALGADNRRVLGLVLRQGLLTCAIGAAIGLAVSLATTKLLRTLLYQVTPYDPGTISAVTLVLLTVTGVACYLPARRATRIDPVAALRGE